MEKGFLEEIGLKKNALIGSIIGLILGVVYFYLKYQIREQLRYPVYLDLGLALVLAVGSALLVTIVLSLARWFVWGLKAEREEFEKERRD